MALTDAQQKIIDEEKRKKDKNKQKAAASNPSVGTGNLSLGLGTSQLSPLELAKKDAATGTTTRDKITFANQSKATDPTNVQNSIRANQERQEARRKARSELTLSEADMGLPSLSQKGILDAKLAWEEAKNNGDRAGMDKAHADAERIRSRYGYSGGKEGTEKIEGPGLTEKDKVTLNKTGQQALLSALTLGDKERAEEIRKKKGFQAVDYSVQRDSEGREIFSRTKEEKERDGDQFMAGLEASAKGFAGSLLSVHETFNQAMRNYNRDRWGRNLEANANQTKDEALAEASRKALEGATIVDPNLPGQRLLRESQEASRKALEGKTGLEALLAKAVISGVQMLPGIAASFVPGVGPALGGAILGAQAAGSKMGELNEQSSQARLLSYMQGGDPKDYGEVTPQEAFTRGIISGGIEALTERLPLKNLVDIVKKSGGASALVSIAKQMGYEATEESASYVLNYAADVLAKDPNARFSWKDLAESAAIGAISGAGFAAGGYAIGSAIGNKTPATGADRLLEVAGIKPRETAQNEQEQTFEQPQQETPATTETPAQGQERGEGAMQQLAQRHADVMARIRAAQDSGTLDQTAYDGFVQELNAINAEEARLVQQERQESGQVSRNFGQEESHIDNRTAADVSARNVKAFQFDHPQLHQYFAEAAQALKTDAEYSFASQRAERGTGTIVQRSEQLARAEGLGLTRQEIVDACDAIINDKGQENYAAAKKVELILDEMLSKGYLPNDSMGGEGRVLANEGYIQAKQAIPGAVTGFDQYMRDNSLALELGETTEEELRAEFEAMGAMSKGGAGAFASWQGQTTGENFHPINEQAAAVTAEQRGRAQTEIPAYNLQGRLTSKTISTFANANILPNEMVTAVESNLADGAYSRLAYTDSQALQDAEAIIVERGFQGAKEYWLTQTADGRINKANSTLGIALINRAANSPSLHVDAMDLLSRYADYAKDAGQALQAMNMINKLTPQGQLYTMVKAVEYMEERAAERGNAVNVEIDPELVTAFMEAETQQERNEIKQEMIKDAAAQLPATWRDRFDSWRYLAMLGNARTHIRNVFGNAGFAVVRGAKNVTAAGLERAFGVKDRTTTVLNRFDAEDRARLTVARGEFPQVKELILSGGKYMDDYSQINQERDVWKMDNRLLNAAFKPVSFLSKKNSEWLDKEDVWFSRPAYTAALARYLKANGVTAEQYAKMKQEARDNPQPATRMVQKEVYAPGTVVKAADRSNYGKVVKYNRDEGTYSVHFVSPGGSEATVTLPASVLSAKGERARVVPAKELLESGDVGGFVEQAQAHAIKEAQKATYRDTNAFSEALSQISRMRYSENKAVRQLGYLAEGVFPFKKTPANILVRGVEYSPIGLAKGLGDAIISNRAESWANKGEGKNVLSKKIIKLEKDLASNAKTPAEAIDEISAGLTGTGLLGLGMALAYLGIATGGASDDDKQDDFNELQGHQNYALEIGNRSLTLDWLAPEALPFFVGVELTKFLQQRSEGEATADDLVSSLMRIADPMLEMSMLQGLNDLFTAFGSDYALSSAAWTAATSYLTQFLPTLAGQFERIGETTRETTFVDPDSGVPKGLQYLLGNIGNKIPGWEYNQVEYVDAWGRKEETGNLALRAFNNLINPAYYSEIQTGSTEAELQRLYDLGYDSVFPSSFQKSAEINGEKVSADQWLAMQTTRGQTAKSVLDSFIGTEQYNAMSDDEKAKFVKKVLEYGADQGKVKGGADAEETFARWQEAAKNAKAEVGLSEAEVIAASAYQSVLGENLDDEVKASFKQGQFEQWVESRTDLTEEQQQYIKDNIKFYSMIPANADRYNKVVDAGYSIERTEELLTARSEYADSNNGLYEFVISQESDYAEQEKLYNAFKDEGATKTWGELAKEQAPVSARIKKAQSALDEAVPAEKQSAFATAISDAGANSQKATKLALLSVDATDAERVAYYNLVSARKGWKKSYYQVDMS